jgi:hypothetical protein
MWTGGQANRITDHNSGVHSFVAGRIDDKLHYGGNKDKDNISTLEVSAASGRSNF